MTKLCGVRLGIFDRSFAHNRHRKNCDAVWPENAAHLADGSHVVSNMLQDMRSKDEIVRSAGKRKPGKVDMVIDARHLQVCGRIAPESLAELLYQERLGRKMDDVHS